MEVASKDYAAGSTTSRGILTTNKMKPIILSLILASCLVVAAAKADYVDLDENFNIEAVAELVCKTTRGTKRLISRSSTISKLDDYLGDLPSNHKLTDCRKKHVGPLAELAVAMDALSDDVCSEDKILLLETYHRKYVSRVWKHLREQKRLGRAPELAKLLFMQYVTEVSSTCEQAALKTIQENQHSFSQEDLSKIESLRKFTDSLGMTDLSGGFKGIYLFWNMLDALDMARHDKFSSYLAEDVPIRLNVQMKDALPIKAVQVMCRHQLKPIYSKSLLPVLRLIDMGYYPQGTKLAADLVAEPNTRGLFFAAQICESLLPMELFSDPQLADDQFVVLTKDEASRLKPVEVPSLDKIIADSPSIKSSPSSLDPEGSTFGATPIDTIKQHVIHRGSVVNRLVKHLARNIKDKLLSAFQGQLRLFSRGEGEQLKPLVDESAVKQVDPEQVLQIVEAREGEEEGLVRNRRGFGDAMKMLPIAFAYSCLQAVFLVFKAVVLAIPTLIALPFIMKGNKKLGKDLEAAWFWGDFLFNK